MKAFALRALAALLVVAAHAQNAEDYRSNSIGMRLAPATGDASDYLLRTSTAGDTREDLLMQQGKEVRRTVTVRNPSDGTVFETVNENGAVVATRTYDFGGRLIEEKNAEEHRSYRYRGGVLEAVAVSEAGGQPLYAERYAYSSRGRLREADRRYADGSRSVSSFLFAEGLLLSERLESPQRVLTVRYDPSGRILAETERSGESVVWDRTRRYNGPGGPLAETVEKRKDHTIRLLYDTAGRLVEETRSGSGAYRAVHSYDDAGRHVRVRRVGAEGTEEWQTEYDAQGRLARENYLARGRIQRVRVHTGDREWHDDLYRDGKPVLRVSYRNDEKIGEEPLP